MLFAQQNTALDYQRARSLARFLKPRSRHSFTRKVAIEFQVRNFLVKTVETYDEFEQVLDLRDTVFQKEFAKKKFSLRSDRDRFDNNADFLIVLDTDSQQLVGTYRVISSCFTDEFYSETEFDLDSFLMRPGIKMELSRACIQREYRQGRVINLLWRAIAQYIQAIGAHYMFGLGSVQTMNATELLNLQGEFLKQGVVSDQFYFSATQKYKLKNLESSPIESAPVEIPSLLNSYFRAGARVCSEPAIDKKFRCADFLMILDIDRLSSNHRSRYME